MKSILRYILLIPVLLLSVACEDYLERMPLDAPSSETFFANETELEMAVTGVYNRLVWNTTEGIPWHLSFDFASDDGWDRNGSPLQALGRGEQNSDNRYTNGIWSHFYRAINRVNFITTRGSHLRDQMDAAKYDRLLAEARFLRAMWYTYLADLYGDIPLVTEVLALADAQTPRVSKSQVIDFVISELDDIINHLPSNANEKGKVTKGAALLLKSRAALWNERWQVAAQAAKQLIDEGTYQLDDDYERMFIFDGDNSPEVITRIQYMRGLHTHNLPRNFFSRMALGHSNKKPPQQMVDSYGCIDGLSIEVSPLYNVNSPFENRDPRLGYTLVVPGSRYVMNTFETHRDSTTVWNYRVDPPTRVTNIEAQHAFASFTGYLYRKHVDPMNYPTDVGSSEQNLTLFRFGEAFLNYAEAKVELNQVDQSVYDAINAIRGRSSVNMPPIEQGKTQAEMRNIVRKERRHEMGMEGLRYFDIRRWKIAENVLPGPVYGRVNRYGAGGWLAQPPKIDPIGTPSYGHISNANELTIIETRAFNPARDYLWPIPRIELETNTTLNQNPQY
jgi:starch-binding outer membrane protein, SusD/RagB family